MSQGDTAVESTVRNETTNSNLPTDEEAAASAERYRKSSFIAFFFPILPQERLRLFLMICMFSQISFTYTFLRIFKDRIVYSVLDNTETKNWLKLLSFFVAQALVVFSQNIASSTNFNSAFKSLTIYFSIFLSLNTLVMFLSQYIPIWNNDIFTESIFNNSTLACRGFSFLYPLVLVLANLPYSVFYILSEVIGSMMVSFCFMTYVNYNTTSNQNKRFFKVLYFFSNITSAFSAKVLKLWSKKYADKSREESDKFFYLFPIIAILLYLSVLLVKVILEKELKNKIVAVNIDSASTKTKSKKIKKGLKESLKVMVNSRLIRYMCVLSCFYNICANLLETANSSGMAASASYLNLDKSFYASGFKSTDAFWTHAATCIIIISPLSLVVDRIGIAHFAAVPLVVSLVGALVQLILATINFPITGSDLMKPFDFFSTMFTSKCPVLESHLCTRIQTAIKVAKYAFYDVIKEDLSMNIDPSQRSAIKGYIDGSVTKAGKSIGSIYGIIMYAYFGAADNRYYFPITALIILFLTCIWFYAIIYVSKAYNKAKANNTYIDLDFADEGKLN